MRAAFVLAGLVLAPTVALAQPSDLKTRAKQYVADGLAAQDGGDYDGAIALYLQGYAIIPHPEILFNLAQAHRLKGDAPRALGYYRRYLAIEPNGRVARDAERWIQALEPQVSEEDADVDLPGIENGTAGDAAAVAPARDPGRTKRIAGVALGVAGGLSLGAGLKFGLDARRISDDLSDHDGAWTDAQLARQDDGRHAETRMYLFTGVGAAALIGGAVLYVLGSQTTVAPIADADTAGISIAGRF